MFSTRQEFINSLGVVPKEVTVTSSATVTTYHMAPEDTIVKVITTSGNAITVYLPPVTAAKGKVYSIALITDGGANLTLTDLGDETKWSDATFADVDDRALVTSDGRYWYTLASSGI